jgi:hypothetical protein
MPLVAAGEAIRRDDDGAGTAASSAADDRSVGYVSRARRHEAFRLIRRRGAGPVDAEVEVCGPVHPAQCGSNYAGRWW